MMIEPKVSKVIAFGAGCLLGIRSCSRKQLPTTTPYPYLGEVLSHIDRHLAFIGVLLKNQDRKQMQIAIALCKKRKLEKTLNFIFILYVQHRELINVLCNHFADKEVTYANFQRLNGYNFKPLLEACVQCTFLFEILMQQNNDLSRECYDYLQTHSITSDVFDELLRPLILMRLLDTSKTNTPLSVPNRCTMRLLS